jgi:DNA-binding NarL/FixJ family response regulator
MKTETTILIADDHPIFRKGLREIVESERGLKVIEETQDGLSAFEHIERRKPDIAILDINMPGMNGFDLARKVKQEGIQVAIIFLTMYKDKHIFNEALDIGVSGYVLKSAALTDIVDCIKVVCEGEHYISPVLASFLMARKRRIDLLAERKPTLKDLTPAELRILQLIAESKTSKEIAEELFISHRTVENHRANICAKLELHGTNSLLKFALEHRSELPTGPEQ